MAYEGEAVSETKTAWNSARIRARLPDALTHDLRRTAVRNMMRAGIGEKQAMLISGHKTRSMFDTYQIIDERDVEMAGKSWQHSKWQRKFGKKFRKSGSKRSIKGSR